MEVKSDTATINISKGYGDYVLWATPAMQLLVHRMNNNPRLKFGVELCASDYYSAHDPRGPQGPCGFAGPMGLITIDRPLKLTAEKGEVLTITFSASKEWYDTHCTEIEQLHVSPGAPGRKHNVLRYSDELVDVTLQFGVYKQKYFDSIYSAMKSACLVDTEEEMAHYGAEDDDYNNDFVVVQEVDPRIDPYNLIKTFETRTTKLSGRRCITLSILAVDVERNSNALKTLLSTV